MQITKSARNVPIGELNNMYREFGLEVDVNNEEIVLLEIGACPHLNVVRLSDGKFVCLKCGESRIVPFGQNVV